MWGIFIKRFGCLAGVIWLNLLTGQAHANEWVVNLATSHFFSEEVNEENFGLGFQNVENEVGYFINSYNDTSVYAGKRYRYKDLSLNYGVIDHPDSNIYITLTYAFRHVQLGISPRVAFLQLKY